MGREGPHPSTQLVSQAPIRFKINHLGSIHRPRPGHRPSLPRHPRRSPRPGRTTRRSTSARPPRTSRYASSRRSSPRRCRLPGRARSGRLARHLTSGAEQLEADDLSPSARTGQSGAALPFQPCRTNGVMASIRDAQSRRDDLNLAISVHLARKRSRRLALTVVAHKGGSLCRSVPTAWCVGEIIG
jgi:hypothetical protein